jgi:hypothetical protein
MAILADCSEVVPVQLQNVPYVPTVEYGHYTLFFSSKAVDFL